jgi:hypothetical protein
MTNNTFIGSASKDNTLLLLPWIGNLKKLIYDDFMRDTGWNEINQLRHPVVKKNQLRHPLTSQGHPYSVHMPYPRRTEVQPNCMHCILCSIESNRCIVTSHIQLNL